MTHTTPEKMLQVLNIPRGGIDTETMDTLSSYFDVSHNASSHRPTQFLCIPKRPSSGERIVVEMGSGKRVLVKTMVVHSCHTDILYVASETDDVKVSSIAHGHQLRLWVVDSRTMIDIYRVNDLENQLANVQAERDALQLRNQTLMGVMIEFDRMKAEVHNDLSYTHPFMCENMEDRPQPHLPPRRTRYRNP